MPSGRVILVPLPATRDCREYTAASIVLGPSTVTFVSITMNSRRHWVTVPLTDLRRIEWDDDPFDQPEPVDEIEYLRQFIANLSEDELEAGVEAMIGVNGMHRQGDWIKAALLKMVG